MDENWITGAKTVVYLLLLGLIIVIITFFITGVGLLVAGWQTFRKHNQTAGIIMMLCGAGLMIADIIFLALRLLVPFISMM